MTSDAHYYLGFTHYNRQLLNSGRYKQAFAANLVKRAGHRKMPRAFKKMQTTIRIDL